MLNWEVKKTLKNYLGEGWNLPIVGDDVRQKGAEKQRET